MVECHSGHTYAERPTAVRWEGERLEVEAIEQEWRTPDGKRFRVKLANGMEFELLYAESDDEWNIKMIIG